jgi:hypothetical protein
MKRFRLVWSYIFTASTRVGQENITHEKKLTLYDTLSSITQNKLLKLPQQSEKISEKHKYESQSSVNDF